MRRASGKDYILSERGSVLVRIVEDGSVVRPSMSKDGRSDLHRLPVGKRCEVCVGVGSVAWVGGRPYRTTANGHAEPVMVEGPAVVHVTRTWPGDAYSFAWHRIERVK